MLQETGSFLLVTVGTSLLTHLKRELATSGLPAIQKAIAFMRKHEPTNILLGAEINSTAHLIDGMKLRQGEPASPFELRFMVSDTEEGAWMGKVLVSYYGKVPGVEQVRWTTVEGLSAKDPKRFERVGLLNLVRESCKALKQAEKRGQFRVINATGGFKAQISFAGLIGQTLNVPVIYQFESFPVCIEMPPMPVDFDRVIWLVNYDLFMKLSQAGAMTERDFDFVTVDPVIRDLLEVIDEDGERLYSLSAILELMHQGFLARRHRGMSEPPPSDAATGKKTRFNADEMSHSPKGTEEFARSLAGKFPWINSIRNVEFLNTSRTHLLPRTGNVSEYCVCFSDGDKGVRLRVTTTCQNEEHRDFVEQKLAEFCAEW